MQLKSNFDMDVGKNKGEDICQIIANLVNKNGISILEDIDRTNALLMDYAPHSNKERRLIITAMREGIVPQLMRIAGKDDIVQKQKLDRCVGELVESIYITEEAARYAVFVLAYAIGMNVQFNWEVSKTCVQENTSNIKTDRNIQGKVYTKNVEILSEEAIQYALKGYDVIGYKAFAANINIRQIILPNDIKVIYPKAFLNCINLSSITISNGIVGIGICAFEGCEALEKITIQDNAIYQVINGVLIDKVNRQSIRAENNKNKDVIQIANGIRTICKKTFDCAPVKVVFIPMSVNNIEDNAFFLTQNLKKIEVDSKNSTYQSIEGVLHNKDGTILVKYPQGKSNISYYVEDTVQEIGIQAFSCAQNIQTITFTSELKKIGNKAFEYCIGIENILLPGNVEAIGDSAFQYCEKLRSVMLSRHIIEIGDCAFLNCVSLETISIPQNVVRIGNLAFAGCKKMRIITIQENVSFIGDGAFIGCDEIKILIKNNPYVETYCHIRGIKYSNI